MPFSSQPGFSSAIAVSFLRADVRNPLYRTPMPTHPRAAVAKLGMAAGTTDELALLIGRKPTTLAQWAKRNRECFEPTEGRGREALEA